MYEEWLDYSKKQIGTRENQLKPATHRRRELDYDRYFKNTCISSKTLSTINSIEIEEFLVNMVIEKDMTKKNLSNVLGNLKAVILFARRKEYIENSPLELVDYKRVKSNCRIAKKKDDKELVLSNEEMSKLIFTTKTKIDNSKFYAQDYAVLLATMTGMRTGELAALKWECIDWQNKLINIIYSEHRNDYNAEDPYYIGPPKCNRLRRFPLTKEIETLLIDLQIAQKEERINSEFVFANQNGRIHGHGITSACYRRCEDANLPTRGIHAIRRTFSSSLNKRMNRAEIASMLGHTEETNEKHYFYDMSSLKEKCCVLTEISNEFRKTN